jgi:hypothetical protein
MGFALKGAQQYVQRKQASEQCGNTNNDLLHYIQLNTKHQINNQRRVAC